MKREECRKREANACEIKKMTKSSEVGSVKKALAILDTFTVDSPELSISEISNKLNIPRPTVARLVSTLVGVGYLKKNRGSRKYSLGMKLFRLSSIVHSSMELTKVAAPLLMELRDQTGETVYMDIIDGDERVCMLSYEGNQLLRTVVPIGQRSILYAGADAKVMLAYQTEQRIDEIINSTGLRPFTEKTITNSQALKQELKKIRQQGFAISQGEFTPGSIAVSCPIWDQNIEVMASVSISFPHARMSDEIKQQYVDELKNVARLISKQIGADENSIKKTWGDAIYE